MDDLSWRELVETLISDEPPEVVTTASNALGPYLQRRPSELEAMCTSIENREAIWDSEAQPLSYVPERLRECARALDRWDIVVPALLALKDHPLDSVRASALAGLAMVDDVDPQIMRAAIDAGGDSIDSIRQSAAGVLGQYTQEPDAVAELRRLQGDRSAAVRAAALQSLFARAVDPPSPTGEAPAAELRLLGPESTDDAGELLREIKEALQSLADRLDEEDEQNFLYQKVIPLVERLEELLLTEAAADQADLRAKAAEAERRFDGVEIAVDGLRYFVRGGAAMLAIDAYNSVSELEPIVRAAIERVG